MLELNMSKTQFVQYWIVLVTICTSSSIVLWFAMNDIDDEKERDQYVAPTLLLLMPLVGTVFASILSKSFSEIPQLY